MKEIRVFVVDDKPMIRLGLAAMIQSEPGLDWVGEAADGAEAVRGIAATAPDVVLMDLVLPGMDGVATLRASQPLAPGAKFIVLMSRPTPADVRRAFDAGACGYLLKSATADELVTAVRHAGLGHALPTCACDDAASASTSNGPGDDLTRRERELLSLMARGHSNQEIAHSLAIAMPTVKFHVTNILAKLQADNRTGAVLVALRRKLVALE